MDIESHPIPQDVTGFQFKLIGEMTIKQFAFLAAGCVLGYIFIASPIFFIIKFPIALTFFIGGFFLAFVPISGRPANTMFMLFLKTLFSQDQYMYKKDGGSLLIFNDELMLPSTQQTTSVSSQKQLDKTSKLEEYLRKSTQAEDTPLDQKESTFFQSVASLSVDTTSTQEPMRTGPRPIIQPVYNPEEHNAGPKQPFDLQSATGNILNSASKQAPDSPSPQIITMQEVKQEESPDKKEEELNRETEVIEKELEEAKKEEILEAQIGKNAEEAHKKVLEFQKQLEEITSQKLEIEKQLLELKKTLETQKQTFSPSQAVQKEETQNVKKIPKNMTQKVGLIAPDVPNLIMGIVKDPRGNILPNILIEIKDKEGNPIRAFKTNKLGQFASATPVSSGTYIMELEDSNGKNKFEAIEIEALGQIIPPIEITSTDEREELRKSLFGVN